MRPTLLLIAAVCLAQPPEKSAVTGRVVNAATGAPLKKANVWLEPFTPDRGVNGKPTVSLTATTDAEGRFALAGVDPGSYYLLARRPGYLDQGYGAPAPQLVGPPLDLTPGKSLDDLTIKLTPQSFLYGKVVDEDGDAVPNVQVTALHASYAGGKRHLVEFASVQSQDDGSFVIGNLTPDRYYLSATLDRVATYYPMSLEPTAAVPIEVAAGAEVRSLNIHLRKSRTFRIRGRVVEEDTGHPARVNLQLSPLNGAEAPTGANTTANGRFEIPGVLPGDYVLSTNTSAGTYLFDGKSISPSDRTAVGRVLITVSDGDVEDVVLPVGPGAKISTTVTGARESRIVLTGPDSGYEGAGPKFENDHIIPGPYTLAVTNLPENSYVKSVTFAGRPVYDWKLDIPAGGGALEIEVSPDAGAVTGVVRNDKGEPARGAVVQLWPVGGDTARSVKSDPRGEFRFHSLAPGDYRVAAFQDLDDDLAQAPPFRALFDSAATRLHIAEKSRERVEVKLIGRDAIAAEAVKLK